MIQTKNHFILLSIFPVLLFKFSQTRARSVWRQASLNDFKGRTFLNTGNSYNCGLYEDYEFMLRT